MADIVSAAASLFGAHGFDGTTMNAIARRSGLSIGSLYQYFPDKDAIVHAVAASYIRAWESKTEALALKVADMDLAQLARRSVEGTVDFDRQHAAIRAFLDADPRRAPSVLEVQTRVDPGIPLLARFYPRAEHRELARVIEIVSLIVRNIAPRIAEEPEEAQSEHVISEISSAVVAYVTSALGAPTPAAAPITDEEGSVTGIFVEGVDVTERRKAEGELRRTADLLRTIVETAPGVIYGKDLEGRMLIANSAALELIGRSWAEVEGRTDAEFLADRAQGEAIMANDRMVIDGGRTQELEEQVSRPGGTPRIYLSKKTPMRDADGKVVGLVGVSVDISDRKAAEEQLRSLNADLEARVAERSAELDRTWRNSQDLLCIIGPDGVFRAANPAWATVLGWQPEDVVGRHHLSFNHPEHREASAAAADAIHGRPQNYVTRALHRDGSARWVAWAASGEGGLIYASGRDITAEREAAEAVARAEDLVRQAQKMEALGQLTGGIAHDFNNMLQGISSAVDLMRRRIEEGRPEEVSRYLDPMRQSVDRAAALSNRLLAFSRRQALATRRVDLDALMPGTASLIRRTVGPAIEVGLSLRDGCWAVRCDPNQFENALLNLAINARDAMLPDGGELRIGTEHVHLHSDAVAGWPDCQPGEFVRITVSDTGIGMPPGVVEHAFEPFFTTKPAGQGTGLGLSQVFGFVSQSNGLVRIDSEPGRGTAVHLFLPRHLGNDAAADEGTNGPDDARRAGGTMKGATVLLVEDEAEIRRLASEALRELGCRIVEAETGGDALALLRQRSGSASAGIDMIVADIGLPGGINGRQLADAARELVPYMPVLLVTGYAGKALGGDADLAPGVELLGKPFTLGELASRVRTALSRSRERA